MKVINIILILTFIYALVSIFVYPAILFEVVAYNQQVDNLQASNAQLHKNNEITRSEINSWEENREGYLRYRLNYIGSGEKFLILDDE